MNEAFLEFSVDFRAPLPVFLQLAEQIGSAIERGEIQSGERLPTVRELARLLDVHFNTAARAYRVLDEAGAITTVRGRGTFVEPVAAGTSGRAPTHARLEALVRALLITAGEAGWTHKQVIELIERLVEGE